MSMNNDETQPLQVPQPDDQPEQAADPTVPVPVGSGTSREETQPVQVEPVSDSGDSGEIQQAFVSTEPDEGNDKKSKKKKVKKAKKGKSRRWLLIVGGIVLIVLLAAVGGLIGYNKAINDRLDAEYDQVAMAAVTQFQLAMEDEAAGRFQMARERYEYVIRLDPNFPGARDRLTQVMLYMAETAVPTEVPTETPIPVTPTPDMRGIEEKYNSAVALVRSSDWDNAITQLELIRKEDINYRAADIDGLFYITLRFRGIQKILSGNLEPGIYDLTLSERFAPLDKDAESYRSWARYYLTGSSFWEVDWSTVVRIFGEIYTSLPNLRDGSGWTAQERYRVGCINYADELAEQESWCDAQYYYQQALALAGNDSLYATATAIHLLCEPPTATPEPTSDATPTLEPTIEATQEPTTETVVEDPTEEIIPTEDLSALCCPPPDPENPDSRCASFTCP